MDHPRLGYPGRHAPTDYPVFVALASWMNGRRQRDVNGGKLDAARQLAQDTQPRGGEERRFWGRLPFSIDENGVPHN